MDFLKRGPAESSALDADEAIQNINKKGYHVQSAKIEMKVGATVGRSAFGQAGSAHKTEEIKLSVS